MNGLFTSGSARRRPLAGRCAAAAAAALWLVAAGSASAATDPADAAAPAEPAGPATTKTPAPTAEARALVDELNRIDSFARVDELASKLAGASPVPVDALAEFLARPRKATDEQRRAVLAVIAAEVPDAEGRFRAPGRQTQKVQTAGDEFNWAGELAAAVSGPLTDAQREVAGDLAAIRALAASERWPGATVVLEFAFDEVGIIYRDECGRYLRKMSPYSLPALIRGSQEGGKKSSMARYANYQLERLDRQNPDKAFTAAPGEDLKIAVIEAFADSQYREAVYTVLNQVDHVAPRVRAAARAAWVEYTTGRDPRPAPKRKLEMPGGKLSDEPEPLWLDHRELANIAIRRRLTELTGEAPPDKASLADMNEMLFDHYDRQRLQALRAEQSKAFELSAAGKHGEAAALLDRILAQAPDFDEREKMAEVYFALAQQLESAGEWRDAAIAYGKTHSLAPEGPLGADALSKHHFARGKSAQAQGQDGSLEFARAAEIDVTKSDGGSPRWLLFAGAGALALGAVLLVVGLTRRRRSA